MATFRTRIETAVVDGRTWRLRVLRDAQQFDDADGSAQRHGVPPSGWSHFGRLWASGLGLARAMALRPVAGLRLLELGCGLGLPSLVLSARGADITATDHHPLAARFLASNARRNGVAPPTFHDLRWSGQDLVLGRFDLIIAADVLYERDQVALLLAMVDQHATRDGEILLADPGRGGTAAFARALAQRGYVAARTRRAQAPDTAGPPRVRLLRFAR